MTTKDYSQTAFLDFLRHGAVTGLIGPATARSRGLQTDAIANIPESRSRELSAHQPTRRVADVDRSQR